MGSKAIFKCSGDHLEKIPEEIMYKIGFNYPQVHTNRWAMVRLSQELKKLKDASICQLPFCVTVEAEAMGAQINLGSARNGPRVGQYVFNHIEELENIQELDLSKGRIKEVLEAVEYLNAQNEIVALNIEGPFTIAASLIEPGIFYKALRKNSDLINPALQIIEDNIVMYASEALKRGARILSYADPVGALEIVGPQVYKTQSGRVTYNILERLTTKSSKAVIHLCGKTSTALERTGLSESKILRHDVKLTYGEVLFDTLRNRDKIIILGHSCFQRIAWNMKAPVIWEIELKG